MSDDELQQVIGKARRFKELRRARERVRQLERELRGEPARPEESPWIPEFLRVQASSGPAHVSSADVASLRVEGTSVATLHDPTETLMDRGTGETRKVSGR